MRNFIGIFLTIIGFHGVCANEVICDELIFSSGAEEKFVEVIKDLVKNSDMHPGQGNSIAQIINLEIVVNNDQIHVRSSKKNSSARNYSQAVTPDEKADLIYITTTLARSSLPRVATSKSSLKKAGDRIDHLHPLRFLMTIFTDEELKANINAIRTRGWIWDQFFEGLEGSLKEESRKENIRPEFVVDFANVIGIDAALIQPAIQEQRWKNFVNILIDTVPRTGDPGRYNM